MTPKIPGAFYGLNIIIQGVPKFGSSESKGALPCCPIFHLCFPFLKKLARNQLIQESEFFRPSTP